MAVPTPVGKMSFTVCATMGMAKGPPDEDPEELPAVLEDAGGVLLPVGADEDLGLAHALPHHSGHGVVDEVPEAVAGRSRRSGTPGGCWGWRCPGNRPCRRSSTPVPCLADVLLQPLQVAGRAVLNVADGEDPDLLRGERIAPDRGGLEGEDLHLGPLDCSTVRFDLVYSPSLLTGLTAH